MSETCSACGQELPYGQEPPELSVVLDEDNDAWQRRDGSWDCVASGADRYVSWAYLNKNYGPITIVYTR